MPEVFNSEGWGIDVRMRLVGARRLAVLLVTVSATFPKLWALSLLPVGLTFHGSTDKSLSTELKFQVI